jgi:phosphoglycolate phosphatase-like HAD superfamily hydrolase
MRDWTRVLLSHHEACRRRFPDERLLVLFDVDDTFLDMRLAVASLLRAYDAAHGSTHFAALDAGALDPFGRGIEALLEHCRVPAAEQPQVLAWYQHKRRCGDIARLAHGPFEGLLALAGWLHRQPGTAVGINSARPEFLRQETLRCLNDLAAGHELHFADELAWFTPHGWRDDVGASKRAAIAQAERRGEQVIAMIDSNPAVLAALAEADYGDDMLLVHSADLLQQWQPLQRESRTPEAA